MQYCITHLYCMATKIEAWVETIPGCAPPFFVAAQEQGLCVYVGVCVCVCVCGCDFSSQDLCMHVYICVNMWYSDDSITL